MGRLEIPLHCAEKQMGNEAIEAGNEAVETANSISSFKGFVGWERAKKGREVVTYALSEKVAFRFGLASVRSRERRCWCALAGQRKASWRGGLTASR